MKDMIPVLEVTPMVSSSLQESKTFKSTGATSLEKCLENPAIRALLHENFLFVWEFIGFMTSSKDIFASPKLNFSLDILFLLGMLVINLVIAAMEIVSLV